MPTWSDYIDFFKQKKEGTILKKRFTALALAAVMGFTLLTGCGGGGDKPEGTPEGETTQTEEAAGGGIVRHNLAADPASIDPALNAAVDGAIVLQNLFEGLCRTDENDKAIPGIAEKWEMSEDGLVYTFHLRDANWSDGKAVTAADFEYAWKRALDPKTAAEYAYQLYYLKNGEEYNSGKAAADDVGVKALDDKTLEVTLKDPTPYFLELMAFPTYFPVRKDVVEKDPEKWALSPETLISNGPFKLQEWTHNDVMKLVKNENYYEADAVKLDGIDFYMIVEPTTGLAAYENGELDYQEPIPQAQIPVLKDSNPDFKIRPYLGTYFYVFNTTVKPVDDPRVRQALTLAVDRTAIVEKVAQGGQLPASGFVPVGLATSDGKEFRGVAGDYGISATANVEKAKALLAEAGYPDGKGFPVLEVYYNTLDTHKAIAEAIQEMWKQNLGIEVNLNNEEWKVFQERRNHLDFVVARHGWIADYADPMTFLDMWLSNSGNNNSGWKNEAFDKLIADSKTASGAERDKILVEAEKLMMEDWISCPIYYYTLPCLVNPKVKNIKMSPLGFVFYRDAYLEQ